MGAFELDMRELAITGNEYSESSFNIFVNTIKTKIDNNFRTESDSTKKQTRTRVANTGPGNTPAIIFLDIKKAFDTVDHKVLIEKLKFYGADGTVILWIKNYLLDRKQATKFLGKKSIFLCIKFCVPQGSLLGPLLFSIYINDLVNACNLSHPYLFADDGALLFENICRKTYLSIRIEMMTILKWLNVNKLSLNVDKTKILIFDNANFSVKIKLSNNYGLCY